MEKKRSKKKKYQILTESEIATLIRSIGIPNDSPITVLSVTPVIDDRYSTILEISTDKATEKKLKIIVDVSFCGPTWEQFMNVAYDSGADCDLKIIVSDGPLDTTWHSVLAFTRLVRLNNSCGIPTYFLEDPNGSLRKARRTISAFKMLEGPKDSKAEISPEPPNKRTIEEADFWLNYFLGPFDEQSFEIDLMASALAPYFPVGMDLKISFI